MRMLLQFVFLFSSCFTHCFAELLSGIVDNLNTSLGTADAFCKDQGKRLTFVTPERFAEERNNYEKDHFWAGKLSYYNELIEKGCFKKRRHTPYTGDRVVDTARKCFRACSVTGVVTFIGLTRKKCFCINQQITPLKKAKNDENCKKNKSMFVYENVHVVTTSDLAGRGDSSIVFQENNKTCIEGNFTLCNDSAQFETPEVTLTPADTKCGSRIQNYLSEYPYICEDRGNTIATIPMYSKDVQKTYNEQEKEGNRLEYCSSLSNGDTVEMLKNSTPCQTLAYFICEKVKVYVPQMSTIISSTQEETIITNTSPVISQPGEKRDQVQWLAIGVTIGVVIVFLVLVAICGTYAFVKRRYVKKERSKIGYTSSKRGSYYENDSCIDHVYDVVEDVATSCSIEGSSNVRKLERLRNANFRLDNDNSSSKNQHESVLESVGETDNDDYLKPGLPARPTDTNDKSLNKTIQNGISTTGIQIDQTKGDKYEHTSNTNRQHEDNKTASKHNLDTKDNINNNINSFDNENDYFILCPGNSEETEKLEQGRDNEAKDLINDDKVSAGEPDKTKIDEYVSLTNDQGGQSDHGLMPNKGKETPESRMEKLDQ